MHHHLDPHERPPDSIRTVYKKYQKMKLHELENDKDIIDISGDDDASANGKLHLVKEYAADDLTATFCAFAGQDAQQQQDTRVLTRVSVYEHEDMPESPLFPFFPSLTKESLFPSTKAEAAIVNLYSPGDTLSVHRDVAETSSTGLVSVSLGCDAIFVIGTSSSEGDGGEVREKVLTLRLRSGSAVYMSGSSRFAWHGVPQIVAGTCPDYLKAWPDTSQKEQEEGKNAEYQDWSGWMANKRVNLNVRQMWDSS